MRSTCVKSVYKTNYSSSRMDENGTFSVVHWKGPTGMKEQYPTLLPNVNLILEELRQHLDSPLSKEVWLHRLLDNLDEESALALFVVEKHTNKKEVVGFVNASIGVPGVTDKVYINHLIATVKRRGVGTLLLQSVLDIVEKIGGKYTFAYLVYNPTETLSLFYNKCGFVDPSGLELPEAWLSKIKRCMCEKFPQLGVKMLSCLGKQPAKEEEAEASTKRQRVLVAGDESV